MWLFTGAGFESTRLTTGNRNSHHDDGLKNPHDYVDLLPNFTFTFMHLADAFIQSDLHCIQVTVFTFYQLLLSLGLEPMILALLAPCSTIWATGKLMWPNVVRTVIELWKDCIMLCRSDITRHACLNALISRHASKSLTKHPDITRRGKASEVDGLRRHPFDR